jgi:hypothetical protein
MKVPVLELGKPTKNNRIYPISVVQKALEKKPQVPIFRNASQSVQVLVGNGVLVLEHDTLFAECTFIDVAIEKQIRDGKLHVRSAGIGSVVNGVVSEDYQLESCFLTDNPA